MKERFKTLLLSTGREGIETIYSNLEKIGFFEAPASTKFHLANRGGLLEHSLNVCDMALMLRDQMLARDPSLDRAIPESSVILCSLLHDVCKAEVYKEGTRNVKNETTGRWETVPSYNVDYSRFPIGHGEKSVIRLMAWGLNLSMDEMLAIRWHMGAWELPFQSYEAMGNISAARDKSPLVTIIQCADQLATGIVEAAGE